MRKIKKFLALGLCGLLAFSAVGCGGGEQNGGGTTGGGEKAVINIEGYEAGVNLNWLRDMAAEFANLNADRITDGKKGVEFDIVPISGLTSTNTMPSSNVHLYVHSGGSGDQAASGKSLANLGYTLNIDDIVTEKIDTRIDEEGNAVQYSIRDKFDKQYYNQMYCGEAPSAVGNGYKQCYGLPSYSVKYGLTLDAWNFKMYGLYLVDEEWAEANKVQYRNSIEKWETEFGSRWFIKQQSDGMSLPTGVKLSCGNDGVYGTWDDGQPTSIEELCILCSRSKYKGVAPFTTYDWDQTINPYRAMWASLGGYGGLHANFYFDSDGEKVEVVDFTKGGLNPGFTTEPMFSGEGLDKINDLYKPHTKEVVITWENGWQANDISSRYYALAFWHIASEMGWFADVASLPDRASQYNHTGMEERFLLNGSSSSHEKMAMLIEGDYWYNESKKAGGVDKFKGAANGFRVSFDNEDVYLTEPDVLWMSLPTQVYGTVSANTQQVNTEENPVDARYYNERAEFLGSSAPIVLNKNMEKKCSAEFIDLVKDFLQFCFTDDNLSYYVGSQGVTKAGMDFPIKDEHMANLSNFQKSHLKSYESSRKVSPAVYSVYQTTEMYSRGFITIDCYDDNTTNLYEAFRGTRYSEGSWALNVKPY